MDQLVILHGMAMNGPAVLRSLDAWRGAIASAFAAPGCPTVVKCATLIHRPGATPRNSLEKPGINNWDFALLKDTRISERFRAQFRAEFFNGWNHTQFGGLRPIARARF